MFVSLRPRSLSLLLLSSLTVALVACPGEMSADAGTDAGHEEHDVEVELCEHMAEGPVEAVTAGADLAGAPDVSEEHTRFDVALIDDGNNMFEGSASFAADEDGEFFVALDADVPLAFFDGSGNAITIEATEDGSDVCDDVGVIHTIDLAVGTVELRFGPTGAAEVRVVIEHGGEHEDE